MWMIKKKSGIQDLNLGSKALQAPTITTKPIPRLVIYSYFNIGKYSKCVLNFTYKLFNIANV